MGFSVQGKGPAWQNEEGSQTSDRDCSTGPTRRKTSSWTLQRAGAPARDTEPPAWATEAEDAVAQQQEEEEAAAGAVGGGAGGASAGAGGGGAPGGASAGEGGAPSPSTVGAEVQGGGSPAVAGVPTKRPPRKRAAVGFLKKK